MSALGTYLRIAGDFMLEMEIGRELKKQELLERWEETFKMPRKKKKRERKHLMAIYEIVNFDPFTLFQ